MDVGEWEIAEYFEKKFGWDVGEDHDVENRAKAGHL
jgi:hypothetical protein